MHSVPLKTGNWLLCRFCVWYFDNCMIIFNNNYGKIRQLIMAINNLCLILQRGDQLVCPQGESLENMLILQDALNDERSCHSNAQELEPTPTPAPVNQPQSNGPSCAQPTIVSSPAANPSVMILSSLQITPC